MRRLAVCRFSLFAFHFSFRFRRDERVMFENPLMLAGLGGAVVPLMIHLLGRTRYRTLEWGAMMFLDPTTPPWRDGARLREYALLAVRMAAVGLLAVALARPVARSAAPAAALTVPDTRAAVALVVDCSASMGYESIGRSRMEAARSAALQVISTLRRGDRAGLYLAGGPGQPAAMQLTGDLQAVAARVADLKPAADVARLDQAIDAASDALARQERVLRQLYVITDQQAINWEGIDASYAVKWQSRRQALDRCVVIPVGGREMDNVAVEAVEILNPPAVRGMIARVAVTVRNYDPRARTGLPLTLRVAGGQSVATSVNVPARSATTLTLPITFTRAASAVLTAEVRGAGGGAAGPALDDRRDHVVEVFEAIRVLRVRGNPLPTPAGDRGRERMPDALSAALAPFASAGRDGADLADAQIVGVADWDAADLAAQCDVVILDDVPAMSEAQAEALEQFVYGGGGLLLAPGASSRIEEYNRLLYRDEDGLMPALLQPTVAPPQPLAIEASTVELASPVMGFLPRDAATQPAGPLSQARVERFFPVTGRTPATHVLAAFESGDAFLLEQPFGRGRVVMVTCSLGSQWSTLPLSNLYLPLVQSAMQYLAGGRTSTLNFSAGDEVVAAIAPVEGASRGVVIRPDGSRDACEVSTPSEERSELRYARTNLPGIYTMRVGPRAAGSAERGVMFSVAADPAESNLTPMAEADWQQLADQLGFTQVEMTEGARLESGREEVEYWMILIACVLGLFVLEMGLTRYWAGGK
jgi:hypothetical protein